MHGWAKTIEPDGTPYSPTLAMELKLSHYGWDKLVCGLVDLYEYGGEKDSLPLLERITDWAMRTLDRTRKAATADDSSRASLRSGTHYPRIFIAPTA